MIFDVWGAGMRGVFFASKFSTDLVREDGMRNRYVNLNESETRCKGRRVWSRNV